ncbi:Rap1a/Tai family immunity protein [Pectobacterium actinidiae]|uniref:Rap1a/Tai family immunity protein n=1 Tax=Pectobacterium actinidiae TaxID=1507808 RepID=A0ABW8G4W9_9GAMM
MKKLLLLGLLGLPFTVSANFYDGNDLNQWAESHNRAGLGTATDSDYLNRRQLMGYVAGVFEFGNGTLFCIPPTGSFTVGQVSDVVGKYVMNHPENRSQSALDVSIQALSQAFPCKKK